MGFIKHLLNNSPFLPSPPLPALRLPILLNPSPSPRILPIHQRALLGISRSGSISLYYFFQKILSKFDKWKVSLKAPAIGESRHVKPVRKFDILSNPKASKRSCSQRGAHNTTYRMDKQFKLSDCKCKVLSFSYLTFFSYFAFHYWT